MTTCSAVVWSFLLAALSCESARLYRELNSTETLKSIYEDTSIPAYTLHLLHLLANSVTIDNNNNVDPKFDPTTDYGSHVYRNDEKLIDETEGCQYYTLGNVNRGKCKSSVPAYVKHPRGYKNFLQDNRARIILGLRANANMWRIRETYLTQHYKRDKHSNSKNSSYDPDHTFIIKPELLKELQQFAFNEDDMALESLINKYKYMKNVPSWNLEYIKTWKAQAPLGLLLFLMNLFKRRKYRSSDSDVCDQIKMEVVTGHGGYASVVWDYVPQGLIDDGVAVVLFKDQQELKTLPISSREGNIETVTILNEGLQPRLHRITWGWFSPTVEQELCRGNQFQNPDAVSVTDFATLQLFVRNGYSCFRIEIDNCDDWKSYFGNSWVALYTSAQESTTNYMSNQWNWVSHFEKVSNTDDSETLEYCTGTVVGPGLQARFMIEDYNVQARTAEWPAYVDGYTIHGRVNDELF